MPRRSLTGTITALATPFDRDGKVSYADLRKLISHQIRGGVDGLVPVGTTGESPTLSHEEHMEVVRHALVGVNLEGTSASSFRGAGYSSAGKTGTAQVVGIKQNEKYNAAKMAEHLRDHALFIAYAPADKPTIALAVLAFSHALVLKYPKSSHLFSSESGEAPSPNGGRAMMPQRNLCDLPCWRVNCFCDLMSKT